MPEDVINRGRLEQTKNQIRKLVAEIADLAESDIQPNEFYVEFLNRAVAAVAASGGAFWMVDGRGGLRLQYQVEFAITGMLDGRMKTAPHDALLGVMLKATQAQHIPPGAAIEGMPQAGNPTDLALIIAPLMVDKQVVGLLEILMDPNRRPAQQSSTLRFVRDLCDLAATYLKNRQMRQMMSQQRLWNQLEGFTHQIHGSLDPKKTAFAVANEGRRLVGCDRLSVALRISGTTIVAAMSDHEFVEQQSILLRDLTRLCEAVIRSEEDLVYIGNSDGFAPEIRDALERYVHHSGSHSVAITLLHTSETARGTASREKVPFGCLAAEQIADHFAANDARARLEMVARHASVALWNSQQHDRIAFRGIFATLGVPRHLLRSTLRRFAAAITVAATFLRSRSVQFVHGFSASVKRDRRKSREGTSMNLDEFPRSTDVVHTYQGFVDAVHDGMAHLTLETTDGQHFELEWDAAELAAKSIWERQPFILQTSTSGDTMRFQFAPDRLHPISSQLLQEIDDLTAHYRATGELDADDE